MTEHGAEIPLQTAPQRSSRIPLIVLAVCILAILGIWLLNYVEVQGPLQHVLKADPRNSVMRAQARFDNWIDLNELVFDVTDVSGSATRADVFRCLLQYAQAMKDHRFKEVILASRGKSKFKVDGDYFQQLGQEYSTQNPVYTIRTFPIHLTATDGTKPFSEYTGGVLGVLQKEMEQFNDFHDQWYVRDFQANAASSTLQSLTPTTPRTQPDTTASTPTTVAPKSAWIVQEPTTNPIDGVKTQFLSVFADETSPLHQQQRLVLSFDNGRLSTKHVGVGLHAEGMVNPVGGEFGEHETRIRVKFDDEKPTNQTWGISDDHDTLFPFGHESQFLVQLLHHKKLIVEFSLYEKAPETVTFDLTGLQDDMKVAGLHDPTGEGKAQQAKAAAKKKKCDALAIEARKLVIGTTAWAAANDKIAAACGDNYL